MYLTQPKNGTCHIRGRCKQLQGMKIFGLNFRSKKNSFEDERRAMQEEQQKLYGSHNIDFRLKIKDDKKAIIKYFIETEEVAKKYHFQGAIHPSFTKELKKIAESEMSNYSEDESFKTFYHLIRLHTLFKPSQKKYPLYQKAYKELIPDIGSLNYYECSIDEFEAYLFFELQKGKNTFGKTNYQEFLQIRKFIFKTHSYQSYPAFRENKEKFRPLLDCLVLIKRIQNGLSSFITNNRLCAGAITLLLLDENQDSKITLKSLHTKDQDEEIIDFIAQFYKAHQNSKANIDLLKDLYQKYPKEWIDWE